MRFLFIFLLFSSFVFGQKKSNLPQNQWVDSVYNQLSFEERVGQLFMVAAYSNKNEAHNKSIDELVEKYKIGGLIFFQGGPVRQAKLTNRYQAKSKIPLFIGIDAEWGLSMRLDSTYRYPWNMTLGAVKDYNLIEQMGKQMAEQSKRMGIHFNFAPVVDINTNPKNPIIGNRSFGEDKFNVTKSAIALTKGLQNGGVFATAKHFPGHGDTSTDSHHTLPVINFDRKRIDEVELYPYKELIKNGLASVMVAHLSVPSLESRSGYPSSISYNIVTNILKNELKFEGLIFTDALNMKGASNFKQPGDIDLEAFLAGNDVLLFAENVPVAITKFKAAFESGNLTAERLEESVKKILKYKYLADLQNYKEVNLTNLFTDLNQSKYDALNFKLFENALTILKNKDKIIIACGEGLDFFDEKTLKNNFSPIINKATVFNNEDCYQIEMTRIMKNGKIIYEKTNALRFNTLFSTKNNILVSNEEEVIRFNELTKIVSFNKAIKSTNNINQLKEHILFGTNSEGLILTDINLKIYDKILSDENISCIETDSNTDEIFVASNKGFYLFKIKNNLLKLVKSYSTKNGLIGGKIVAIKSTPTKIYITSLNGFSMLNREIITGNKIWGKIDFNGFLINGDESEKAAKPNVFERNQNNLALKTSIFSLQSVSNFNTHYLISRNGESSDWYYFNEKNLQFRDLQFGNYIVKLKLTSANNNITYDEKTIQFKIKPYLWETLLFKILIIGIFVLTLLTFYFYYKRKTTRKSSSHLMAESSVAYSCY